MPLVTYTYCFSYLARNKISSPISVLFFSNRTLVDVAYHMDSPRLPPLYFFPRSSPQRCLLRTPPPWPMPRPRATWSRRHLNSCEWAWPSHQAYSPWCPRCRRPSLRGLRGSACLPYGTSYETSTVIKETHTNQLYYRSWSPYASQTLLEPTSTNCWKLFYGEAEKPKLQLFKGSSSKQTLITHEAKKIASPIKLPCAKWSLNTLTFVLSN